MAAVFTRPGFSTVTVTDEQLESAASGEFRDLFREKLERLGRDSAYLNVAHAVAIQIWDREAKEKGVALEITADEYQRRAGQGLVAELLEKNAANYAARATTPFQQNVAASLYRQAARAIRGE